MFIMSDLLIELLSTKKSYTFSLQNTSLDSVALNPSDILPKENRVEKLTFSLFALNLIIYFPLTNK